MPSPTKKTDDLEFVVMPRDSSADVSQLEPTTLSTPEKPSKKWQGYVLLAGIVLIILGGGYFAYQKFFTPEDETPSVENNPEIVVPPAPVVEADTDNDGLEDADEIRYATSATLPDTDGDGLADGDEINIYQSDPLLPDTDGDKYDDGKEVAGGYSPIVNSTQKAAASEIQAWTQAVSVYEVHEPTPTTLKVKAPQAQQQAKVAYVNAAYKYTLQLPAVLTYRESEEGRLVGIYVAGTEPEDEVLLDPITLRVAVKVGTETLKDWINSQYQKNSYEFLQDQTIGGILAVRIVGFKQGDDCPQNMTFLPKDNTIIVATWTCNQNTPFADLYTQILESFKFQ